MAKVHFNKTYKNPDELVRLLQSRGLNIMDKNRAERYIESIGYYRLSAYMYPLLEIPKSNHLFKNGTAFDKVIMLYRFDKKLRILLFNEIEKIEVAVREAVMNLTADRTGDMYDRSTEDFIEHFKQTYTEQFPPAWILGELLPMGSVNIYYRNLKDKTLKKHIAKRFYLHAPVFESWLSVLTLTRNACCHHSRVWNKVNKIIPNDMRGMTRPWITLPSDKRKIYYNICIIKYFLDVISPKNDMLAKLRWLFVDFPEIDLNALGFPKGWEMEPLWR